ncbi:hypothetical protein N2F28_05935 [Leuconostoc falkenbergense]|jgi:hypothetical protein|uniref:Uncharacterized protein n=1 Tax=Leuconostoc falkenbergense TaxID=2766470 RepID=A0A9X3EA57_9LACO|nr:hypothetical protein [Leuconostoc falkenbergense]MCT4411627.1 hypothetical protein [Leuconostoc falkenbergense]MCX7579688.1 hypothetical protein [Leuconostoc falkenbergense]RDG19284.1 hypothetical protein DQM11_03880 [Leuconostoc pseudomesenteroides]VTU70920.1 hypothetical protein AMBR_MGDJBKAP_01536 [Leuconostoc pseudomesenteroides]
MVFKERIATFFPAVDKEPALRVELSKKQKTFAIPIYVSLFKIHFEKKYTFTVALRRQDGKFITSRDFDVIVPKSDRGGYIMKDNTINITGNFIMDGITIPDIEDGETYQLLGTLQAENVFSPDTSLLSYFEVSIK